MPLIPGQVPIYLQSGNPETEAVQTLAYPGQLGMKFVWAVKDEFGTTWVKRYQLVQVAPGSGTVPFPGCSVLWADLASYIVSVDVSGALGKPAGVLWAAIPPGWYGCLQIGGYAHNVRTIAGSASPNGAFVTLSNTPGQVAVVAFNTAAPVRPLGTTLSGIGDVGAGSVVDVLLDLPDVP